MPACYRDGRMRGDRFRFALCIRRTASLIAACTLLIFTTAPLQAQRQLSWDALDVDARLNNDGVLHVVETHTMVFTGD